MTAKPLAVKLNGMPLTPTDDISEPFPNTDPPLLGTAETLAAWIVPASLRRDGPNEMIIALAAGEPIEVAFLDLAVA
jgi:hypothetical protein